MRKLLAILLLGFSCAQAQTVQTTPNLITNPTFVGTTGWTTTGAVGGNGPTHPALPANGNGYTFTYSQGSIAQTYAINQALSGVGAGVQIAGFDYGFKYRFGCANGYGGNCENLNGIQDTLNATSTITSNTGATLYTRYYALGNNAPAPYSATFSSVDTQQRFNSSLPVETLGAFKISFTGQDNGYWGGNYGPTIKDVYSKAVYTVDPCVANPAYSTSCANYNTVVTSSNLFTGVTGPQAYAINEALSNAGAGATIHGFNYGYNYNVAGRSCAIWDIFGLCLTGFNYSDAGVSTVITDSNNATVFSESNVHNGGNNGTSGAYSKQFRFGASRPIATLGGFAMAPWTNGNASITNMYSNAVYTADPCLDPLSSPSCSGYAAAYQIQQCTANPLYNSACPGYAEAIFAQQCSANQLYNPSCPGYASAYLVYQCNANPLYSTTCPGYEQAYLDQQCGISPLYSQSCSGYRTAYHNQQCSINPLYAVTCTGYASAYHDQQCSTNPLYATTCTGYASAYHAQQCSINPLYSTTCTGYAAAYLAQQCNLNGLYDRACPNYSEAYAKKMLLEKQGMASTVATAGVIAAQAPEPTTTTSTTNDGSSSVAVAVVADPIVNQAVTSTATSASPAAAATATVPLAPPPPAPAPPAAENKPAAQDKKPEGGQQPTQQAQGGGGDKPQPSARQALAERRAEAAKKDAVEKGKNLANEMGKAADMEAQKQVQNVVIAAMGFTPGFDAYGKSIVPDVIGYRPFTVYNNQKTVDNARTLRQLSGASDRLHNEIVDSQYNRGN